MNIPKLFCISLVLMLAMNLQAPGFNVPWKFPSVQCQGISGMALETSRHYTTERKRWKCFFCFGQIWGSFTKSRHQSS